MVPNIFDLAYLFLQWDKFISFNMSIKQTNITMNKKELEFNITFKYDIAGRKVVVIKWKGRIEWGKWIMSMKTYSESGIRPGTKTAESFGRILRSGRWGIMSQVRK